MSSKAAFPQRITDRILPARGPDAVTPKQAQAVVLHLVSELERYVSERARAARDVQHLLTDLAPVDVVTGLSSRLGFEGILKRDIALCQRTARPLALLVIRLGGPGLVNGTLDRVAVDTVRWLVAATMRGQIRAADAAGQWATDTFCVVLPATDRTGALVAARRLLRAVRLVVTNLGGPLADALVEASMAVSCAPEDGDSADDLISRAQLIPAEQEPTGYTSAPQHDPGRHTRGIAKERSVDHRAEPGRLRRGLRRLWSWRTGE